MQRIADELRAACELPDVKARIAAMGFELKASTPEEFAETYRRELPVWGRLKSPASSWSRATHDSAGSWILTALLYFSALKPF